MTTDRRFIPSILAVHPHPEPHFTFHNFSKFTLPRTAAYPLAMAAAPHQTAITFRSRSQPSSKLQTQPTTKLSLSSNLKIPKLTIKPLLRRRVRCGATAADAAVESYANALADVAKSNNTLDQTSADVGKLEKLFSDEQVLKFFSNPTIGNEEKHKIADEISKLSSLQPHVANFLKILVDKNRINLIKEIVKEFEVAYNKLTNTELAIVTSVVKLETQHLAQIAKGVQKLTGAKNVRIKTMIDPSLVAGFTIRFGNSGSKLIDLSVKKQLEEMAEQLNLGDIQLTV